MAAVSLDESVRARLAQHLVSNVVKIHERNLSQGIFSSLPGKSGAEEVPGNAAEALGHKICIIGAGCAGLYAAMILDTLGIEYEILEAKPGTPRGTFIYPPV